MSSNSGRPRLAWLFFVASMTLLTLLACQSALRGTSTGWVKLPEPAPYPTLPSWPSEVNYTAAIIYLSEKRRLNQTLHSLGSLQRFIPWRSQWPIILLHTGDFDDHDMVEEFYAKLEEHVWTRSFSEDIRRRIEFVRIEFTFPPGVSPDKHVYKPEVWADRWPEYQHMCYFFAQNVFHHPRIRNLTYYMRMDTDSYIMKPLCYDPIDYIHRRNRVYVYNREGRDWAGVVRGMWNLVDQYAHLHPEVEDRLRRNRWPWPSNRDRWIPEGIHYHGDGFPAYSNNFEIVKLEAFQRPDVVRFIKELMKNPDRIYSLRWGDAPIRGAVVNMFFEVEEVEKLCALDYWHGELMAAECECKPY